DIMPSLTSVEAIHSATVFEDCVDQLSILGQIMPVSYEEAKDAEERFEQTMKQKQQVTGNTKSAVERRGDLQSQGRKVGSELKNNMHIFSRSLKQSPLTTDNMEKVQADRAFAERVLYGTLLEISNSGSFQVLMDAVKNEKDKKARLQETILKEEQGRKRVRALQRQVVDVRREKEVEIQQRNEMIAHLKDQLQEMKAKTNMEGKYIKKCAEVGVAQTQKKCIIMEKDNRSEIESLKDKIDEENRVNAEVESYLLTHQERLQKMMEHWMEKYDKDVEAKQKELDILKASKAKDLERLQELTKMYAEYEQVVVEDRIDKEKARRKAEMEAEELKSAVRLQSWWRGTMVRKGLGPYSKKKKKGKKGKKSGKKKKK
ncbi:hypothetical protein CAPTEDRAFT_92017, partial [Capitella teleta]